MKPQACQRISVSICLFVDKVLNFKFNWLHIILLDLLHKPVARLQKNALVLHDLLKYVDSRNEEEQYLLKEALKMTQAFLNELNLDVAKKLFPVLVWFIHFDVKWTFYLLTIFCLFRFKTNLSED